MSSVMDACTNDVMEVLESLSHQDKAFEMGEVYRRLSLDVMLRSAFGVESDIQKNQGITGVNEMLEQIADHEDKSFTGWLPFLFSKHVMLPLFFFKLLFKNLDVLTPYILGLPFFFFFQNLKRAN